MTDEEYFTQMQKHVNWLGKELDECFREKFTQLPREFQNADVAITAVETLLVNTLRISITTTEELQEEIAELPHKISLMFEHLQPTRGSNH